MSSERKKIFFNEEDLYPLLPENTYLYQDEQEHAALVDAHLGLETAHTEKIILAENAERQVSEGADVQYWLGLPVKALLTPYTEIRQILNAVHLSAGQHIVDLGAGYGRMAFVVGEHHHDSYFTGYEVIAARVNEGNRCLEKQGYIKGGVSPNLVMNAGRGTTHVGHAGSNVKLVTADVTAPDFEMPEAQIYFIYDFGSRRAISTAIERLKLIAGRQRIQVVGRGRAVRDCVEREHPWLSQVTAPLHFAHFSIYSS